MHCTENGWLKVRVLSKTLCRYEIFWKGYFNFPLLHLVTLSYACLHELGPRIIRDKISSDLHNIIYIYIYVIWYIFNSPHMNWIKSYKTQENLSIKLSFLYFAIFLSLLNHLSWFRFLRHFCLLRPIMRVTRFHKNRSYLRWHTSRVTPLVIEQTLKNCLFAITDCMQVDEVKNITARCSKSIKRRN